MKAPGAQAYAVSLYRVLEEDPWRAELLWERRYRGWEEAAAAFTELLGRLEGEGYSCMEHASAWHMLCVRQMGAERVWDDFLGEEVEAPVLEKRLLALTPLP